MYLLNHVEPLGLDDSEVDLHSTMYLLNLSGMGRCGHLMMIYIPLCIY